jgi:rare lipoprotein A (peptidoglycan hydrolase)
MLMVKMGQMKAKTKRRIRHVLTKKKLVKKKTSRHVLRTFLIGLATISTGSLAYAITLNKPTVSINVHSSGPAGIELSAPVLAPAPTPEPVDGPPAQSGRGSWYALGLPAPDALTCASRTFPRGTYLKVTDLDNGASMVCLVNDYGPAAWTGRVIDLSRGSFRQIDNLGVGTIPVQIRIASGPTGLNLPYYDNFVAVVGYDYCLNAHTSQYCDSHRQD